MNDTKARDGLRLVVGVTALVAPALHTLSDLLEWQQGGFSTGQLRLNYVAFLPMPWLLLGLYAARERPRDAAGLAGALLYGAAFAYFMHTTLLALDQRLPTYEALWQQLGREYTFWGGVMVVGGLAFVWSELRAPCLPRLAIWLFAAGLVANLMLALVPAPAISQVIASAVRNVGLIGMGYGTLRRLRS